MSIMRLWFCKVKWGFRLLLPHWCYATTMITNVAFFLHFISKDYKKAMFYYEAWLVAMLHVPVYFTCVSIQEESQKEISTSSIGYPRVMLLWIPRYKFLPTPALISILLTNCRTPFLFIDIFLELCPLSTKKF